MQVEFYLCRLNWKLPDQSANDITCLTTTNLQSTVNVGLLITAFTADIGFTLLPINRCKSGLTYKPKEDYSACALYLNALFCLYAYIPCYINKQTSCYYFNHNGV